MPSICPGKAVSGASSSKVVHQKLGQLDLLKWWKLVQGGKTIRKMLLKDTPTKIMLNTKRILKWGYGKKERSSFSILILSHDSPNREKKVWVQAFLPIIKVSLLPGKFKNKFKTLWIGRTELHLGILKFLRINDIEF